MGGFGGIANMIGGGLSNALGTGGVAAGGGIGETLGELFKNKLFLQYLSGIGADLMGNTPGKNLGAITQQNIASQNYMKILTKMLAGEIPEGGKIVHSDTGVKIDIPRLKSEGADLFTGGQGPLGSQPTSRYGSLSPFPTSQPGISASDLAGLSPQDITQALELKMTQEQLGQKRISDIADIMYKSKLMEYYDSQMAENMSQSETAKVNALRQWYETATKDQRTDLIQNYEYAKTKEGGSYTGSLANFKTDSDTGDWDNYQKAVKQGYDKSFVEYQKELRSSGATRISIGEAAERAAAIKKATGEVEGQVTLDNPKEMNDIIAKDLKSLDETHVDMWRIRREDPNKAARMEAATVINSIEKVITGAGGKFTKDLSKDGRTVIWHITWRDGSTREYSRAIR